MRGRQKKTQTAIQSKRHSAGQTKKHATYWSHNTHRWSLQKTQARHNADRAITKKKVCYSKTNHKARSDKKRTHLSPVNKVKLSSGTTSITEEDTQHEGVGGRRVSLRLLTHHVLLRWQVPPDVGVCELPQPPVILRRLLLLLLKLLLLLLRLPTIVSRGTGSKGIPAASSLRGINTKHKHTNTHKRERGHRCQDSARFVFCVLCVIFSSVIFFRRMKRLDAWSQQIGSGLPLYPFLGSCFEVVIAHGGRHYRELLGLELFIVPQRANYRRPKRTQRSRGANRHTYSGAGGHRAYLLDRQRA